MSLPRILKRSPVRRFGRFLGSVVALTAGLASAHAQFTPGSLVVVRVGTGTGGLTTSATAVFLDEYTTSGSLVASRPLPTTATVTGNAALTLAGSGTAEGALQLSADGRYLTLAGYNATVGTGSVSTSGVDRVVARVELSTGTIDTTTRITDGYTANSIRSAVTDDGSRFWTGGNGSGGTGGTRLVTLGSTGASTQISTTVTNTRVVEIAGGQLYTSAATAPVIGVATVGTGLPTAAGQPTTQLVNTPNAYGYAFLDRSPTVAGVDTLYVADQAGGLFKFSFNGSTWTARSSFAGQLTGLTARDNGTSVDLYATSGTGSGNSIIRITDTAAFDENLSATSTPIATAGANTAFRGLELTPVPEPGTVLGLAAAGLGLAGLARRVTRRSWRSP
jgi:hypothetical protein